MCLDVYTAVDDWETRERTGGRGWLARSANRWHSLSRRSGGPSAAYGGSQHSGADAASPCSACAGCTPRIATGGSPGRTGHRHWRAPPHGRAPAGRPAPPAHRASCRRSRSSANRKAWRPAKPASASATGSTCRSSCCDCVPYGRRSSHGHPPPHSSGTHARTDHHRSLRGASTVSGAWASSRR
jgi:hypothetical protein